VTVIACVACGDANEVVCHVFMLLLKAWKRWIEDDCMFYFISVAMLFLISSVF